MQTRRRNLFVTVHSEGALLPMDLLQRIVDGDRRLGGLEAKDYHLDEGAKIREAIEQVWGKMLGRWPNLQSALQKQPAGAPAFKDTWDKWLLPLFADLGYGRLQKRQEPIMLGTELDRHYDVSHSWEHAPIHLLGWGVELDRRTPGVRDYKCDKRSPHSMIQELLNRSDKHQWAFLSNGRQLRILRNNSSLTRQAYVEFDLEAMFRGEVYQDFQLLWLLCHQSRVEGATAGDCWLERWRQSAEAAGTRALDQLRDGVQDAIEILARGFIDPRMQNDGLRQALRDGWLSKEDFYRQVLRLVYRLLFLFVAEDRSLLAPPGADKTAVERYRRYYSTDRLRKLAEKRCGSDHADLYQALKLVMDRLHEKGCPELGLPALGGFLWLSGALGKKEGERRVSLMDCRVTNKALLQAVYVLAFTTENNVRRPVDYRNLGSEELGSVYESLLEMVPQLDMERGTFTLTVLPGNERKQAGAYYTPTSLIKCLLDSALDPVLDEVCRQDKPEEALLRLKVCDPACGSGHFLIAAAYRIAQRLAAVRSGEEEATPEAVRSALRDVIGKCVYGVDANLMAVELCKVALWMETLDPGKPLSFLDHHIRWGNSLLGATPALLKEGIPDEAFEPIEGDEREYCQKLKRQNKTERAEQKQGQKRFAWEQMGNLPEAFMQLGTIKDDSIEGVQAQQTRYNEYVNSTNYLSGTTFADAWCAAFVWPKVKVPDQPEPITESKFRTIEEHPLKAWNTTRGEISRLAEQYRFFHWHLAFPDVFRMPGKDEKPENQQTGWSGGFDVVLGNPPWDTLSPDAKEFFSAYDQQVRFQDKAGQQELIRKLLESPAIAARWASSCREIYGHVHLIKKSGRYRLFAPGNLGKGDFNVYRMFIETALAIARPKGRIAQVVPEGLYNGANCMAIRKAFFTECSLQQILGFENANEVWFTDIDTRMKFCVYSLQRDGNTSSFRTAFNIRSVSQLLEVTSGKALAMPVDLVREFSPDALAIMELGNQQDIDICVKMYRWPKFGASDAGSPRRVYMREVDMGADRDLFSEDSSGLPLYEGRMVDQFDHRAKGYRSGRGRAAEWADLPFSLATKSIQPQWHIPADKVPEKVRKRVGQYRVGFCDVASPTNERSLVAALIPPKTVCGHKVPTIAFEGGFEWAYPYWLAVANSFTMDFIARKKISLSMSYTVLDSLPFPRLAADDPRVGQIVPLVLRLVCTGPEMTSFWSLMATQGWVDLVPEGQIPPGILDEEERLVAKAELDATVARNVFDLTRAELEYVLDTFPVYCGYQQETYGEYRSRRLILEIYDALETSSQTGQPYPTRVG